MLRILGSSRSVCSGLSRREILQVGGAGLMGLGLSTILQAEAKGAIKPGRAKSVIFVFLFGGPSQLDTFDIKPDAPSEIRGPFQPIASRSSDLRVCEHLPRLAAMSNQFAVVRTVTHKQNDHNACHYLQTGHPMPIAPRGAAGVDASEKDWPAMGSVIEYLDERSGRQRKTVPSYVYLPNRLGHIQGYDRLGQYAGWLGREYNALATDIRKKDKTDNPYFRSCDDAELDFRIKGLADDANVTLNLLDERRNLLTQFSDERRRLDDSRSVGNYNRVRQKAIDLIASDEMRRALDIRREPVELRERYGRHLFGQTALMGRRMIEAGARFVTVLWDAPDGYSWDSHATSDDVKKHLLPGLDQSLSALLEDLRQRGLLDETLVVCLGEMGRTPRGNSRWGRDHWSYCFPALFAGAGIQGGVVYGRSDKHAAYPTDQPVSPEDIASTIFDAMGIDQHTTLNDREGRPVSLVENGRILRELYG